MIDSTLAKSGLHDVRLRKHGIEMSFRCIKNAKNLVPKLVLARQPNTQIIWLVQQNIAFVQIAHSAQFQQRTVGLLLRHFCHIVIEIGGNMLNKKKTPLDSIHYSHQTNDKTGNPLFTNVHMRHWQRKKKQKKTI